jgi:hypothetical protein
MLAWQGLLSLAKHLVPMAALVRVVTPASRAVSRDAAREQHVVRLALWADAWWGHGHSSCLERSLVMYRFLSGIGARPRLVVGARKQGARVEGHVWVEVDGRAVAEEPRVRGFVPVTAFAGGATEAAGGEARTQPGG